MQIALRRVCFGLLVFAPPLTRPTCPFYLNLPYLLFPSRVLYIYIFLFSSFLFPLRLSSAVAISDITPIDARSRQVSDAHEEKSTDNNSNNNNTATTSAFRSKSQPTTTIIPPLRASLVEDEKGENSNGSSVLANARRRNKSSPRNKTAESPSSTTGSTSSPRKKNTPSPRKKKDSLPSSALKQKVLDFGKDKDNSNSGSVFAHSDPPHSSLRREKVSVRRPHEELDAEEQSIDPTVDGDDTDEERNTPEGDNVRVTIKVYIRLMPLLCIQCDSSSYVLFLLAVEGL